MMKVLDKRDKEQCQYSFEMLSQLVLMAVSAKSENILAVSQWIEDQHENLFALGFRSRQGEKKLPSQASIYRFFWALEEQVKALEYNLNAWASQALSERHQPGEVVCIGVDGKHVIGSKRPRRGEEALLLSYFVHDLGLSLGQAVVETTEAKTAQKMLGALQGLEHLPWVFTGDAAFAERPVVEAILDKGGTYLFDLKDNLSDVRANAEWAFSLATCEQDSCVEVSEVRSGEVWLREIETRPAPPDLTNDFPAAIQFVRCIRTVVNKATGEIRFKETEYGLTSTYADASQLYRWWRGHWQIENSSHHKCDTIWREDACRTRKAAQAFAALRNLVLSLFHLKHGKHVLRHARRCHIHPPSAFELLGFGA